MLPTITTATVVLNIGRPSHFDCPECRRKLMLRNTFPLEFSYKRCPGCERVWSQWPRAQHGTGIFAEDRDGELVQIDVVSADA